MGLLTVVWFHDHFGQQRVSLTPIALVSRRSWRHMATETHRTLFLKSLKRCSRAERFITSFYDRFQSSSEQVRFRFRNTDFDSQNAMLLHSLELIAGATEGDSASLRELKERAESHDRYHLNIKPELYDLWLSAMIQTAADFDELWDDDVHEAWTVILGHVVHHMTRYY